MSEIDDYEQILESLPKGYVATKKIAGKTYYYLQWREASQVKGTYLPKDKVSRVLQGISERKRIEKLIKDIKKRNFQRLPTLGKTSNDLTGSVMSGNHVAVTFKKGLLVFLDKRYAPLFFLHNSNLEAWLAGRSIDKHRPNSRLLKKALRITETEDPKIALKAHGATISDDYWFKPSHSPLKYQDVHFKTDYFASAALKGDPTALSLEPTLTPELTATGSYEKCWKIIDSSWWMYKKENELERFSEYFCYLLGKEMGLPFATYELVDNFIRTKNFADKYNSEPMSALVGDDDRFEVVFAGILPFSNQVKEDYIHLIWFDCLVENVDRHNENCGLLKDRVTGEIVGLAPNFDNNLALVANNYPPKNILRTKDGLIEIFKKFVNENKAAGSIFAKMELPPLTDEMLYRCFAMNPIKVDEKGVSQYLKNGYEQLLKVKNNLRSISRT
jgi:hypothetical protein